MPHRWLQWRLWFWIGLALLAVYIAHTLPIGQRLNLVFAPLLEAMKQPQHWAHETELWLQSRARLQATNEQLLQDLQQQAVLKQRLNTLHEENIQLRRLLGLKTLADYRWQTARVRGRSPDKMSRYLVINVQTPVKTDDVVASGEGLVGLVDRTQAKHATVRTVLDASMAVPVTISGTDLSALVRGQGDRLSIDFIRWDKAPAVGSVLQTSGAGGIFPPGIPVARITRIRQVQGDIFANVEGEPAAHWRRDSWLAVASHITPKK
ncbi:MAG TPA: rod shape-determining protein MreC [Mariprofundaceae bacterium]|nr:rod shape-determining protein MreC [Mariprofundaceae bacterium]